MWKIRYLLIVLFMYLIAVPASASSDISTKTLIDIKVNGQFINCDIRPFIDSGTTYVPIRFVGEALCADEVSWNAQNNTAIIRDSGNEIVLPIGKNYAYINGAVVKISSGTKLIDGRTFVPVRFVSENLGATVNWDGNYFIVSINRGSTVVPAILIKNRGYSDDDIYWMSRIIEAESSGEPIEGKIGVGNVILNRVLSNEYPNTVHDVIFDSNFGIQFEPVSNGAIYNAPSHDSIVAAKYTLEGKNIVGNCMYFLNPVIATGWWIVNNRAYYSTIGNHNFYV